MTFYVLCVAFRYETSPTMRISYEPLEFPSVTIFNVNSIRVSKLEYYGSDELVAFLSESRPSADYQTTNPSAQQQQQQESDQPDDGQPISARRRKVITRLSVLSAAIGSRTGSIV